MARFKIFLLLGCLLGVPAAPLAAAMTVVDMACEHGVNPLGVDTAQPRLSWKLQSDQRGDRQTAYQIIAAASAAALQTGAGDLWDSGRVESSETMLLPYAGKRLGSAQAVFWKVRVWDATGKVSAWSEPARWTMGVLQKADWHAQWIGAADTNIPSLLLRREFAVKRGLQRALVNICGLGQYELTLNGQKAGDDFLSPGWTKYNRTCLYDTRDLTAGLQPGQNAVGVELGNGMYRIPPGNRYTKFKGSFGPQQVIAQIRLEYADGTVEIIGTDETWRVAPGAITFTSIYGGEDLDARRVQKNWDAPGFDDARWWPAVVRQEPGGELRGLSGAAPPLRFFEVHAPIAVTQLTNGNRVFDLGQNAAHLPRITVTGPAGSKVRLLPAELTGKDGAADQTSMGPATIGKIRCEFTKATDADESWSPKFFFIGCRYLEAQYIPATPAGALPKIKEITGVVVQSASPPAGRFTCSNPLFNRIYQFVRWAQRSNLASVLTDCPHREHLGWLEEAHLNGPALRYDFDLDQLFTKALNDMADSQLPNGLVPNIAPEYAVFRDGFRDSPEWGSACILVPWQQYEFSGDLELFRRHYDAMKHYVAYLGRRADNGLLNYVDYSRAAVHYGLGDWHGAKIPAQLTATAFYFEDAKTLARAAKLLGKAGDAKNYSELAEKIRAAFNQKFYNATNRCYAPDTQAANAIPLVMGICEPTNRAAVLAAIVTDVRRRGNALTAGDVGYRYLLRALADGGRSDVVFDINNQSEKPGYGYQLKHGATSLTENWNGNPSQSQNHFMLGQIQEWFFHDLAGIQPAEPGFKHIRIKPAVVGDVAWVKADYHSASGNIVSEWQRAGDQFTLKICIPANTTATVCVPAAAADLVREGKIPARQSAGVKFLRMDGPAAWFEVGSGEYTFASTLPAAPGGYDLSH